MPCDRRGVRRTATGIWLSLAGVSLALAGCVSVRITGAASVGDLQAEDAYIAAYMKGLTALQADFRRYAPSGSQPGVCNKGGTKQGCFDADAATLVDLRAMSGGLAAMTVPPRFADADRLLKDALEKNVRALELRSKALSTGDEAAWDAHAPLLRQAEQAWSDAYAAFPPDHRPPLSP